MKEYFFDNRIYYRTNELKPDRPTLVFAHGASGSSSAWFPYEKIFENKYNILTYDIRGHGLSKKYLNYSDYEIKNFAKDLNDLISYLNIRKFILISNSFAGLVHLEYLKSWKNDIMANIFTSPEVYVNQEFSAKILRPTLKLLYEIVVLFPFDPKPRGQVDYQKHIGSTDWNIKRNLADMKNTTPRVLFSVLRQSLNPRQEYSLEKITSPTLIIHGEKDSMIPIKNAITMSKKINHSEFVRIRNVDHNTVHNAVKEMSEAIEQFVKKI